MTSRAFLNLRKMADAIISKAEQAFQDAFLNAADEISITVLIELPNGALPSQEERIIQVEVDGFQSGRPQGIEDAALSLEDLSSRSRRASEILRLPTDPAARRDDLAEYIVNLGDLGFSVIAVSPEEALLRAAAIVDEGYIFDAGFLDRARAITKNARVARFYSQAPALLAEKITDGASPRR
jgi:hypothetical protein